MFRQVAILGVWPTNAEPVHLFDSIFMPERQEIDAVGLLTVGMDIPCRRRTPTFQRVWAETSEDVSESRLVGNVIARLDALTRAGPTTIVTFGGCRRDWPALRTAALRSDTDMGVFAAVDAQSGAVIGQAPVELVDLAMWLGGPTFADHVGCPALVGGLGDRADIICTKTAQLYRVFLRFLAVTGRMSSTVYQSADHAVGEEVRRLRNRSYKIKHKCSG